MVVPMKNRREFLKIFGMVTAAGAALATVGVATKAAPGLVDTAICVKTPKMVENFHSPVKRFVDIDPGWLGGPDDDVHKWRNIWANLSGRGAEEAKKVDTKVYGPNVHWNPAPEMQEQMIGNVFKESPLFEYLKASETIDTDTTLTLTSDAFVIDTNLLRTTGSTQINILDTGAYCKTWDTFKGNE